MSKEKVELKLKIVVIELIFSYSEFIGKNKRFLMSLVRKLVSLLVIIGALNWGLWGFFQFDLVAFIFDGNSTKMARLIYSIVGVAGVVSLRAFFKCSSSCDTNTKGGKGCCK
jgi:uncharacterized membrane protein YuzA (DUF378 family)